MCAASLLTLSLFARVIWPRIFARVGRRKDAERSILNLYAKICMLKFLAKINMRLNDGF